MIYKHLDILDFVRESKILKKKIVLHKNTAYFLLGILGCVENSEHVGEKNK